METHTLVVFQVAFYVFGLIASLYSLYVTKHTLARVAAFLAVMSFCGLWYFDDIESNKIISASAIGSFTMDGTQDGPGKEWTSKQERNDGSIAFMKDARLLLLLRSRYIVATGSSRRATASMQADLLVGDSRAPHGVDELINDATEVRIRLPGVPEIASSTLREGNILVTVNGTKHIWFTLPAQTFHGDEVVIPHARASTHGLGWELRTRVASLYAVIARFSIDMWIDMWQLIVLFLTGIFVAWQAYATKELVKNETRPVVEVSVINHEPEGTRLQFLNRRMETPALVWTTIQVVVDGVMITEPLEPRLSGREPWRVMYDIYKTAGLSNINNIITKYGSRRLKLVMGIHLAPLFLKERKEPFYRKEYRFDTVTKGWVDTHWGIADQFFKE